MGFLDTILESCPSVITMNHQSILPNCLSQIGLKSKGSDKTNSKLTVLQWKTEVLQRVSKILKLVQQSSQKENVDNVSMQHSGGDFYMSLIAEKRCSVTLKDIVENKSNKNVNAEFVQFQQELKTILFDCWVEAINQQDSGKQKSNLIKEALVPTLSVIVELLLTIQCFQDEKIMLGVTKNFPFEILPTTKSKEKVDIEEMNLNICLLVLNAKGYEKMVIEYLCRFQIDTSAHASQIATILLKIPNDKIPELHPVIHQLATKFSFNEDVADLMLVLSRVDVNESAVKLWIEGLPGIITNAKVTKSHLEAVRILFKSRNEVMLKAFQTMAALPPESLKQPGLLDQVWRILAFVKPSQIPQDDLINAVKKSTVNSNTKNYVC